MARGARSASWCSWRWPPHRLRRAAVLEPRGGSRWLGQLGLREHGPRPARGPHRRAPGGARRGCEPAGASSRGRSSALALRGGPAAAGRWRRSIPPVSRLHSRRSPRSSPDGTPAPWSSFRRSSRCSPRLLMYFAGAASSRCRGLSPSRGAAHPGRLPRLRVPCGAADERHRSRRRGPWRPCCFALRSRRARRVGGGGGRRFRDRRAPYRPTCALLLARARLRAAWRVRTRRPVRRRRRLHFAVFLGL